VNAAIVLVADASVLVAFVLDSGAMGAAARSRLADNDLMVPDIAVVEATSAIRRIMLQSPDSEVRAESAVVDLLATPLSAVPCAPLIPRTWELRHNMSTYDACYVALAEHLDCPLITLDRRLAASPGAACVIERLTLDDA